MNKTDYLLAQGAEPEEANGSSLCALTPHLKPNWAQEMVQEEPATFACTACIAAALAPMRAEALAAERAAQVDWSGVRSRRNIELDRSVWCVLPGSPLTSECQAAYAEYRAALNRLTITFTHPDEVVWPEPPALAYSTGD